MAHNEKENKGNFWYLSEFPFLQNIAQSAEYYVYSDPAVSLNKQRLFAEKVTELLFSEHFLQHPYNDTFHNRLHILKKEGVLNDVKIRNCFYQIKDKGNIAVHEGKGTKTDALSGLLNTYRIAVWVTEAYGEPGSELPRGFKKPENLDARHALNELQKEYDSLEKLYAEKLSEIEIISEKKSQSELEDLKLKAFIASSKMQLTEEETRDIIDRQLRDAGWEADSVNLRYAKGTRPEKGKNKAIAEWKIKGGRADYALFIGEDLYGVVEAKKKSKGVTLSDMTQAKRYALNAEKEDGINLLPVATDYKVPFLFTTNSTFENYQYENRSGTWFLDGRKKTNHPQTLRNWFSPQDLKERFKIDREAALHNLQIKSDSYLQSKDGLSLRDYQMRAVKAVENAVSTEGADRALLAMATGTGKTRTVLGICYRLLDAKRFKRILFLVDRTLLGEQAADTFKDTTIEGLNKFAQIYDIKELTDIKPDLDTRVHFATVQGLYRRIFDSENAENIPTVGLYDCIIVDEAHRGYNLDRDMDEEEQEFKNESDYRSKYRQVLEYFNAFRIGLTATPAPHTINVFGRPVFSYPYPQAVVEGYLIGYEPPYIIKTELSEGGIIWSPGEVIKVYNRETKKIENLEDIEDEVTVEISGFNKRVLTESWNKTVLGVLADEISPDGPEKTLIFAANTDHAADVVKWFKEVYTEKGIPVDDDSIKQITGSVDKPKSLVKHFKNERLPTIVVTVDLLTTGIDVPSICNLVFLRRVNSRILYEQMIGRATRLCPEIDKESFRIYDAVGLYDNLEEVSNLRPTVVKPKTTFTGLTDELLHIDHIESEATRTRAQEKQIEQLIAKLNRKRRSITTAQEEDFQKLSGGISSDDFVNQIRDKERTESVDYIRKHKRVFQYLDEMRGTPQYQMISDHADSFTDMSRNYLVTYEAEDYLAKFKEYILENRNKSAALELICTRPKELTRESLKELLLQLKLEKFDTKSLDTAWKSAKNEDIAADIISYIRTLALGDPLVAHEDRIKNAVKKVRGMKNWTRVQEKWLSRFENQLLQENILHKNDLDKGIFKQEGGGFQRLNKIFGDELETVLEVINDNLYGSTG